MQWETFAPLAEIPFIFHAFSLRTDANTKADDFPRQALLTLDYKSFASAEQPHGNNIAIATHPGIFPGVDALITGQPGLPLVIRCADCAAVYIIDRRTPAIGLIHSGKKGTLTNVTANTVTAMRDFLGTKPGDCAAFISPCIGPCHYEMDIRSEIEKQLDTAGIKEIHNSPVCTACHLDRYFSYRAEKGQTGRMLAVLSLR